MPFVARFMGQPLAEISHMTVCTGEGYLQSEDDGLPSFLLIRSISARMNM